MPPGWRLFHVCRSTRKSLFFEVPIKKPSRLELFFKFLASLTFLTALRSRGIERRRSGSADCPISPTREQARNPCDELCTMSKSVFLFIVSKGNSFVDFMLHTKCSLTFSQLYGIVVVEDGTTLRKPIACVRAWPLLGSRRQLRPRT